MDVLRNQAGMASGLAGLGRVQSGASGTLPWSPGSATTGMGGGGGAFSVQPRFHRGVFGQSMQNPAVNGVSAGAGAARGRDDAVSGGNELLTRLSAIARAIQGAGQGG